MDLKLRMRASKRRKNHQQRIDIKKIVEHLKQRGIGVLITDHNVRETLSVCEHAYIVSYGELIASGDAESILSNQQVKDVYLGEQFTL